MKLSHLISLSFALVGAPAISSAAPTDAPASRAPTTVQEWITLMGPDSLAAALGECIESVKTVGATTSVALSDGTRAELVQGEQGLPQNINTFDRKGQLQQSVDVATVAMPDRAVVREAVTRRDADQEKKRMETSAFLALIRARCHAMAHHRPALPAGEGNVDPVELNAYMAIVKELNAAMLEKATAAMKAERAPTPQR